MRRTVLLGLLVGSNAYADHTTLHFTAAGSVAATDNVFGSAINPESDLFFQIRPGVLLSHDGPRLIQVYTAEAEVLEYLNHNDKPSVTYLGGWTGNFLVSPLIDVIGVAKASTGTLNALTVRGNADQPVVTVVPAGDTTVNQVDASEVLLKQQLDKTYRLRQGLAAHYVGTQDDKDAQTSSFDGDLTLGAERIWEANNLQLLFDLDYIHLRRFAPDPVPPPNPPVANPAGNRIDQQLNPRATLLWRHDYNRYFSSALSAGLTTLNPFGTDPFNPTDKHRPAGLYSIGSAALNYTQLWGHAGIIVARTVLPDLLLAETTLNTSAIATLALPLPFLDDSHRLAPKLVVIGSAAFLRSEVIPTEQIVGTLGQGTFDVYRVDASIAYSPHPGQTYALRYEHVFQTGDAAAQMLLPPYSRDTIFFTFAFRYPERLAVDLAKQGQLGSNSLTESNRADRTDILPMDEAPKEEDAGPNGVTGAQKPEE